MTKRDLNDIFVNSEKYCDQLNKFLDPPQIKQCSNDWHEMTFQMLHNKLAKNILIVLQIYCK